MNNNNINCIIFFKTIFWSQLLLFSECFDPKQLTRMSLILEVILNAGHFWVLFPDMMLVMGCEFVVDWIKHAFITKFNDISYDVMSLFPSVTLTNDVKLHSVLYRAGLQRIQCQHFLRHRRKQTSRRKHSLERIHHTIDRVIKWGEWCWKLQMHRST